MPIERHFVGRRRLSDGLDADRPNAVLVEELAREPREYAHEAECCGASGDAWASFFVHSLLTGGIPGQYGEGVTGQ